MKTITHIFKTYFPDTAGGLEEAIRQIGKMSLKHGYDVQVVTISDNPRDERIDGIRVHSFKRDFSISTMHISFDLARHFKEIIDQSDIVQLHYPYPYTELLTILNKVKKPIVVTFHAPIVGRPLLMAGYNPFAKALFRNASVIVPTSINLAKSTDILQRFMDKVIDINLWLDENRFERLGDASEEFKKEVASWGKFALFTGVMRLYKGIDVMLDAAKKIDGVLVMSGKGKFLQYAKDRVAKEGITNVKILGFQPDENLAYLLKSCSHLILPSINRGECFGQVLLEAMYYHKAMISTELGTGTSFVNKDGETGFVLQPYDVDGLAEKMNLLFKDDELCHRLGENAYQRYRENFTEEIQGKKYIEIYDRLLGQQVK